MTFSDSQEAYDVREPNDCLFFGQSYSEAEKRFFDNGEVSKAIEDMAHEMLSDTPDLKIIVECMAFICEEHDVDFEQNKFNMRGK